MTITIPNTDSRRSRLVLAAQYPAFSTFEAQVMHLTANMHPEAQRICYRRLEEDYRLQPQPSLDILARLSRVHEVARLTKVVVELKNRRPKR